MNTDKKVSDFMNAFLDTPEPSIDKEYYQIEEKYKALFGHAVPRAMMPDSISVDSIKSAMKTCIENKEDTLFNILGIELNDDFIY